eukprot:gene30383-35391_t
MEQYEKLERLGEGKFGKVFKAKDIKTGNLVALKKILLYNILEEGVPSYTLREVCLLKMLIAVERVEENERTCIYLVFEYLSTDLKKWMVKIGRGPQYPIPSQTIKNLMYQLLKGVAHTHAHGVLHRDLKPQNLLIEESPSLCLKVADFGSSRAFSIPGKSYTHEVMTLWYRAPEVLLGTTHYTTPVDMWSVGCIFAELAGKTPLLTGDCEIQQLLHIFEMFGTPNEDTWPGVTKLRDWHTWPQWTPKDMSTILPALEPGGLDLLKLMMAKAAMDHAYFDDLQNTCADEDSDRESKRQRC